MKTQKYIRFEDEGLHTAFIQVLNRTAVSYALDESRAVVFAKTDEVTVMGAANQIRDAQFPWYLLKWKTETASERYRAVLTAAGLPFIVERHESGTWFLVRRADRAQHDQLWPKVLEETGDPSGDT